MGLKEGIYVRSDDGYIFKIKELLEKGKYNDSDNKIVQRFRIDGMYQKNDDYIETDYMYSDWVIKASYNIIDLIEVGDVIKFDITDTDNYADIQGYNCWEISCEEELNRVKEMIEMESAKLISIVTKERFESISYKVD